MAELTLRQKKILDAIKKNYRDTLESKMVANISASFSGQEKYGISLEKISTWVKDIEDVKTLEKSYLDKLVNSPTILQKLGNGALAVLAGGGLGAASFIGINAMQTSPLGWIKTALGFDIADPSSTITKTATGVFSAALGALVTKAIYDSFNNAEKGDSYGDFETFKSQLEKETAFSNAIKAQCENLSKELVKLFHFREMLLLGKLSDDPIEQDARNLFLQRINVSDSQNKMAINAAIESYFLQELTNLFNVGFKKLYEVHDDEIVSEEKSAFRKWFNRLRESTSQRQETTQQIQLKFMELCRDFLVAEANEPTILAKYPKFTATASGLLVGAAVLGTLALVLGGPVTWGVAAIALVAFAVVTLASYKLVTGVDALHYKRDKDNRREIDKTVKKIEGEFLRLQKELAGRPATTAANLKEAHDFKKINDSFLHLFKGKEVARGSSSGWIREYAARYRHSKAIEIDLGDDLRTLIVESDKQTKAIIDELNNEKLDLLSKFIADTSSYLQSEANKNTINDYQLIQKIKEQVIHISANIKVVPKPLLEFYKKPIDEGGLGGFEQDLTGALWLSQGTKNNPYDNLCETALQLNKDIEAFHEKLFFKGYSIMREALGLAPEKKLQLTADNIDSYLNHSFEFLLSLTQKIAPPKEGGINPLNQAVVTSPKFILYRTLLLKQLAYLADPGNPEVDAVVQSKIRSFVTDNFGLNPAIVFDDLLNQSYLREEPKEEDTRYKNKDGETLIASQLDNVLEAVHLDIAYNSVKFTPQKTIDFYITQFMKQHKSSHQGVFAHGHAQTHLVPGGEDYKMHISKYIENTKEFLDAHQQHPELINSGVLLCYEYAVAVQVFTGILAIAKQLPKCKEAKEVNALLSAFSLLHGFAQDRQFVYEEENACSVIKTLEKLAKLKEGENINLSDLPGQSEINLMIEKVATRGIIKIPEKKGETKVTTVGFFKRERESAVTIEAGSEHQFK